MAAYYRFPFTWTQWQELERQALIYKYMMASVPVPPNLLIPTYLSTSNISNSTEGRGSFNRRFSHNVDPEPGRCRRTDGKKWRCSKDAAPGQKYCERHVHRGRPRSRKPVEFQSQTNNTPSAIAEIQAPSSGFLPNKQLPYQTVSETQERGPKYLNWMRGEGGHISSSNQSWKLMESKIGVKGSTNLGNESLPLRQNDDYLNLNFSHFGNGDTASQQRYDPCSLFLNSELTLEAINQRESLSAKESTIANTAPTNTWIKTEDDSGNAKVPFSSLKFFASGGNEGSMDQIQMGLGLSDSYMGCSKEPSFGGPLGEVLQSGTAGGESPQRVVSPTGVLQKAFGSVSDSSGSSSPTFAAAKSEVALQWLNNQAKLCD